MTDTARKPRPSCGEYGGRLAGDVPCPTKRGLDLKTGLCRLHRPESLLLEQIDIEEFLGKLGRGETLLKLEARRLAVPKALLNWYLLKNVGQDRLTAVVEKGWPIYKKQQQRNAQAGVFTLPDGRTVSAEEIGAYLAKQAAG